MTLAATLDAAAPRLRRAMGFRDLLFFYLITGFSVRWISNAAAAGPSAVIIWLGACVALYVPLAVTVLELSSRYPDEGGCYVWSKRAFGDFAGFITGWTYWTSNLPYFPSLLYFTAANALFLGGHESQALAGSPAYFVVFALLGLAVAAGLNIVGLDVGKWLHNAGAIGLWVPAGILVALGAVSYIKFGSATPLTAESLVPSTHFKDIVFWATIAFSLSGLESASMLGEEIEQPRRDIPRALLIAGVLITLLYILSTLAVMVALPRAEILNLQGFMTAIQRAGERLGVHDVTTVAAALLVVGGLGQAGAWFAASGRLPFVAGLDRFLPAAFGRIHPRFGSPYVSLVSQAVIAAVFIFLGQAGTTVKGAYDVLVSMAIIAYFVPYVFMFAAMIRIQREPAGPGVIRAPGGAPVAIALAALGLTTTLVAIGLSLVPAPDEPNKPLAVVKVAGLSLLLILAGAAVFAIGRRGQR